MAHRARCATEKTFVATILWRTEQIYGCATEIKNGAPQITYSVVVELGHAIGGQCGGATGGNAVRAIRKRNGVGEGHIDARKLAVYDARRAFDGK